MIINNYLLSDIIKTLVAFLIFPCLLFIPGFLFARYSNLLNFNNSSLINKMTLSVVLSISIMPLISYLTLLFFSYHILIIAITFFTTIFLLLFFSKYKRVIEIIKKFFSTSDKTKWYIIITLVIFFTSILLLLVDLQISNRIYLGLISIDYQKHVAITDAISRTGIPPFNPFIYPGYKVELFYYYFWDIICSIIDKIGGTLISPRISVFAGTLWIFIGFISTVILFVKEKYYDNKKCYRQILICIGLVLVTGLDIIPTLIILIQGTFNPTIEWWNEEITAWFNAILWVPQHIASFISCLLGIYVYSEIMDKKFNIKNTSIYVIVISICFASAIGLSIWVSLVLTISLMVWFMRCLLLKKFNDAILLIFIGMTTVIMIIPFIINLSNANNYSGSFISFSIREFRPIEIFLRNNFDSTFLKDLIRILFLPINYFLEFGVFIVAPIIYWLNYLKSRNKIGNKDLFFLTITFISFFICTFFRSSVANNDLGWRGFMFAQFFLLNWTAKYFSEYKRLIYFNNERTRLLIVYLVIIGFLGILYNFFGTRFYELIYEKSSRQGEYSIGRMNYDARNAYEYMDANIRSDQLVQHNPYRLIEYYHGLYCNRQTAIVDLHNGKIFGINNQEFNGVYSDVVDLFETNRKDTNYINEICKKYSIDFLVIKKTDKIWYENKGQVINSIPFYQNESIKIYHIQDIKSQTAEQGNNKIN